MPKAKFCRCATCVGVRLHQVLVRKDARTGYHVRVWACSACDTAEVPVAGICCPECGAAGLAVKYVRHPRPGAIARVRVCLKCGHRIRTRETVVSYAC